MEKCVHLCVPLRRIADGKNCTFPCPTWPITHGKLCTFHCHTWAYCQWKTVHFTVTLGRIANRKLCTFHRPTWGNCPWKIASRLPKKASGDGMALIKASVYSPALAAFLQTLRAFEVAWRRSFVAKPSPRFFFIEVRLQARFCQVLAVCPKLISLHTTCKNFEEEGKKKEK